MILGVVGAGTMGAGIAQLGCAAGMRTLLHDPLPEALEVGERRVRDGLGRWVAKGRADESAAGLLELAPELADLAPCELVIEAAPERPEIKRELFERLSEACGPETVLAADETPLAAGLENERRLFELAMATEDRVEGMTAFVEKRPPEFRGR